MMEMTHVEPGCGQAENHEHRDHQLIRTRRRRTQNQNTAAARSGMSNRSGMSPFVHRYLLLPLLLLIIVSFSLAAGERHPLTLRVEDKDPVQIDAIDTLGVIFVSVNDLIESLELPFGASPETRKIEFRLPAHRIKVTANNPYLVLTEVATNSASVYQMPVPSILEGGVYYVPVTELVKVVGLLWPERMSYDDEKLALVVGSAPDQPVFDVTGIDIEPRLNGYLLTVLAAKKLGDVEAWLKPDGWLFVTITDATADSLALANTRPVGAIRQILVFQSPTSVQLTFRVAPDVVKADVVNEPGTNNLLISLHTQSAAERADIEKQRSAMMQERLAQDRSRWKMDVIVLDAGHGGRDPGTIGVRGTKEKDITLAITLKLGALIEKNLKDVKVVYTRKTDTFVELYRRTQIANEAGGKLFVSVHCNSTPRKPSRQNGFEIYLLRPGKTDDAIEIAERENSVIELEESYQERYQELTEEYFILYTMAQSAFMKYSEDFAEVAARAMSMPVASSKPSRNSSRGQGGSRSIS